MIAMIVVGAGLRGTIRDICKRCASSHTLGDKPPPMIKRNVTKANPTRHMRSAMRHTFSLARCQNCRGATNLAATLRASILQ